MTSKAVMDAEITFFTRKKGSPKKVSQDDASISEFSFASRPISDQFSTLKSTRMQVDQQLSAFDSRFMDDDEVFSIVRSQDSVDMAFDEQFEINSRTSGQLMSRPQPMVANESWATLTTHGPLCTRCGAPTGDDAVFHGSLPFHKKHFTCKICNTPLDENAVEINNEVYCQACSNAISSSEIHESGLRCCVCGSPRTSTSVLVPGKCFCRDHFRCYKCNCLLDQDSYVQRAGKFYCTEHVPERPKILCAACGSEIIDRTVRALGHAYHPSCFNCCICKSSLVNMQFTALKGKPLCYECYKKLPRHIRASISRSAARGVY